MRDPMHSWRVRRLGLATVVAVAAVTGIAAVALPAEAATTAAVTVNAEQDLATFPATGIGMNVAVYAGAMNGPDIPGLLKNAGVGLVRYPGGGYGDGYHWETHTVEGGYVAPNTDFDTFMGTVRSAGAQPIIIANYGSGTPEEAAGWVRYANVTKGYGAKYWEIGNEVYGNGLYGATWETDKHDSKTATTYATNLLSYATAMKAVDPTIKIGAVLTTPGSWPDGIVGTGDTMDWNNTVMSIAGKSIDFVVVHHYPYATSQAELLSRPQTEIPGMASTLKSLINQYAGGRDVGIAVTEASSLYYKNTSPSGLFAPDEYLTWLENGAFTLDWWNLHNGTDCSKITTVEGATDYDDGGMLSSGASCEPPLNTPFAPYYGTQMITKLAAAGDTLVSAASSSALVTAHAARRPNGDVSVMLINKDPANDATVNLSYAGFTPSSAIPTTYTYLKNGTSIGTATAGSAGLQTIPAYSIVVVQLHAGSGGSTSSSPSTSPTASPSPSSGTATCAVKYTKNEWQGGLVADVAITNTGSTVVNGWTLAFTFPGDTKVSNAWNATVQQTGAAVTATSVTYNTTIAVGGTVSFGFQGTWATNDANPTSFTLNGRSC
ncbi:cellulose binding domain-containing protein [Actinoplanes sp. NPDC051851]|uniref:cellulose binding domain-containing protein n=1 Tax=Actinoplanes sp. NPDC051851 TaxID=3154753 RepID=UPI003415CD7E